MQLVLFIFRYPLGHLFTPHGLLRRLIPVALVMLLVAGCEEQPTKNAQELPYQGQSIRVAVPQGWGFKEQWDLQLSEWTAQTGAQAQLVELDMRDGAGPLLKAGEAPQLILFPWTRRGELLAEKQLQALPDDALVESQLDWNDVFQGLREKQGNSEVGSTFVPLSSPVLVCYYRQDLLERAGLAAPETWADYQKLLDQLDTWAPGLKAVEPWSPDFRATMFLARALPYVKHAGHYSIFFDIENGNPFIATPGFVRALEETQQAIKKLPPEVFQYDPVTCRELVMSGAAALAIGLETGPSSAPLVMGATQPQSAPKKKTSRGAGVTIGFCRLPGTHEVYNPTVKAWVEAENSTVNHVSLTGFAGLCAGVPSGTTPTQTMAALNLLSTLLLDPGSTFPANSRSLCRESQTPNAADWVGKDLSASEAGKYVSITAKSLRDRQQSSELPVLGHVEFRKGLTNGLTAALEQGKPAGETLNGIAEEWKGLLKKIGSEKVLSSYRGSLGLIKLEEL